MKINKRAIFYIPIICICSLFLWWHIDIPQLPSQVVLPIGDDLKYQIKDFLYPDNVRQDVLSFKHVNMKKAQIGKQLFFDERLSSNGKISCASCHIPEKNFSDPRGKSIALGETRRRTPSAVNHFDSTWFFWDGRADSLEAQALGPLENAAEHGISRWFAVRLLKEHYQKSYEQIYGPWPEDILPESLLKSMDHAMPPEQMLIIDTTVAAYTLASLKDLSRQDAVLSLAAKAGLSPAAYLAANLHPQSQTNSLWAKNWESLSKSKQDAVDLIFSRIGELIASYERTLVAIDSPFDAFAHKWLADSDPKPERAFSDRFGAKELHGLQLFLKIGCTNCHRGRRFTDDQFHNIGVPADSPSDPIDIGRSAGLLQAQNSLFNCQGPYRNKKADQNQESCQELPWLDKNNLEFVGAFKTPSLRNAAERGPFMHDGSLKTLEDVLKHYKEISKKNAPVGHIEESLKPFDLTEEEERDLISFIQSLSSKLLSK